MKNEIEKEIDKLSILIGNIKIGSEISLERINEFKDSVKISRILNNDNIKQNPIKKQEPEINSFVVFDEESCTKEHYEKYYKERFSLYFM